MNDEVAYVKSRTRVDNEKKKIIHHVPTTRAKIFRRLVEYTAPRGNARLSARGPNVTKASSSDGG